LKNILILVIAFMGLALVRADVQVPVALWPAGAPGALGTSSNDIPTLTAFVSEVTNTTHTALLVFPGGAYENVDLHGGTNYALWLNQFGVTCFVLKYRVGSQGYHYPAMFDDATRATRWVRAHASDFKLNPHHIGIMGVSAGGHLATTVMTHFDPGDTNAPDPVERRSSRPDFAVLCYPVITMNGEFANQVSRANLLGPKASTKLAKLLSSELHVTEETPPCFIWTSEGDGGVPMENSLMFAAALRKNSVRFELHVYERGGHAKGLPDESPTTSTHMGLAEIHAWLKEHKWAN
jgi:acetyl esterase/lipase